jgi:hypothetical protein
LQIRRFTLPIVPKVSSICLKIKSSLVTLETRNWITLIMTQSGETDKIETPCIRAFTLCSKAYSKALQGISIYTWMHLPTQKLRLPISSADHIHTFCHLKTKEYVGFYNREGLLPQDFSNYHAYTLQLLPSGL